MDRCYTSVVMDCYCVLVAKGGCYALVAMGGCYALVAMGGCYGWLLCIGGYITDAVQLLISLCFLVYLHFVVYMYVCVCVCVCLYAGSGEDWLPCDDQGIRGRGRKRDSQSP